MLCFKDQTFCGSDCVNEDCHRYFGDAQRAEAKAWAARSGLRFPPVMMADYSKRCDDYRKPGHEVSDEEQAG